MQLFLSNYISVLIIERSFAVAAKKVKHIGGPTKLGSCKWEFYTLRNDRCQHLLCGSQLLLKCVTSSCMNTIH